MLKKGLIKKLLKQTKYLLYDIVYVVLVWAIKILNSYNNSKIDSIFQSKYLLDKYFIVKKSQLL